MYDFINPEHPAVRELALKLKNRPPVDSELLWVGSNISYGMGRCLDLELETGEPISLRKDYEVLKTREGMCADQSFLLASLLRNRLPPESVKLVQVSSERLYKEYLSDPDQLGDPFNHMCVAVLGKEKTEILDPTSGSRRSSDFSSVCDDYAAFDRVYNQRASGVVASLRSGWVTLSTLNAQEGIYGLLKDDKFYRLYSVLHDGLVETWSMPKSIPEKVEEKYVRINRNESLSLLREESIGRKTRKRLRNHVQDRSFVDKLKKRMDRPSRDVAYL